MKRLIIFFGIFLGIVVFSGYTPFQKKRVLFFGDSITSAGVSPKGYITLLQQRLIKDGKDKNFELIGAGVGGNKIYDLYFRLEEDVLSKNPDLVFIYIGINDVWHKKSAGTGTDPGKFVQFYKKIIDKIQAGGAKVVICTPTVIGERKNFVNELDGDLNKYAQLIREIAKDKKVGLIDLRKVVLDFINAHNPEDKDKDKDKGILTTDGVHMNDEGNQLLAEQFWNYIK